MLTARQFHEIVSGAARGPGPAALRLALAAAELPYAAAMRVRNWRYDTGLAATERASVPVISVGNLTLGGTGKTPLVEWLARWARRQGLRVAIVSRGYGAAAGSRNDEALELEEKLPDVPHVQNADRVAGAQLAVEELAAQLIVLDDGFQHRRIARDLDLVLLDALEPFGLRHVFPRGLLREPLAGLARAHVVGLSRAAMLSESGREQVRRVVQRYAPRADWIELDHAPLRLRGATGQQVPVEQLAERPIAAFCGIGAPQAFRNTLQRCGYRVVLWRDFPDHHPYSRADVDELSRWADSQPVEALVCTHKDLVKLGVDRLGSRPLWALEIGVRLLAGQEPLEARLRALAARAAARAD